MYYIYCLLNYIVCVYIYVHIDSWIDRCRILFFQQIKSRYYIKLIIKLTNLQYCLKTVLLINCNIAQTVWQNLCELSK